MSGKFLTQLARRALTVTEVRPRVAARFESAMPLEQSVERISEAPDPPAVRVPVAPALASLSAPREPSRAPDMPVEMTATPRTIVRHEVAEQSLEHASPALRDTPAPVARVAQPAAAPVPQPIVTPSSRTTTSEVREKSSALAPVPREPEPAPLILRPLILEAPIVQQVAPRNSLAIVPAAIVAPLVAAAPPPPAVRARAAVEVSPALIEIVIGRIEIRSEGTTIGAPRSAPPSPPRVATSLGDYLRSREGAPR